MRTGLSGREQVRAKRSGGAAARAGTPTRSSTVARVRRKADALLGMRLLKKPKIPIAKAISVAIGMAQPDIAPPLPALRAT